MVQEQTTPKTVTRKNNLHEAKNIRGHEKVKQPWRNSSIVASLGTLVNRRQHNVSAGIASKHHNAQFDSLQAAFKQELSVVFREINSGEDPSSKKMKKVFRKYYTMAFKMGLSAAKGRVSPQNVSTEDSRWIESFLKKEFAYWKKFSKDMKSNTGRLSYERRLEMYVSTLRSMFTSAKVIHAPAHTVFHWVTTPGEKCTHCLFLERMSPYTKENIPTIPASGDTKCKSGCRCHLDVKTVSMAEYLSIKNKNVARNELLRMMRRV